MPSVLWDASAFFEGAALAAQRALPDLSVGVLRQDARVLSRAAGRLTPGNIAIGPGLVEGWFEYRRRRPTGKLPEEILTLARGRREPLTSMRSTTILQGWAGLTDKTKDPSFSGLIVGAQSALKCLRPELTYGVLGRDLEVLPSLFSELQTGLYRQTGVSRESGPLLFAAQFVDFRLSPQGRRSDFTLSFLASPTGPRFATVSVDTDPTNATLWVDKREFGKTPVSRLVMEAERLHVLAARKGWMKAREEKTLKPGDNPPIRLVLSFLPVDVP